MGEKIIAFVVMFMVGLFILTVVVSIIDSVMKKRTKSLIEKADVTGLINIVNKNNDARDAIAGLGSLKDIRSADLLISLLSKDDFSTAGEALDKFGPELVEPLIDSLKNEKIPEKVFQLLGKFRDKRAVQPLIEALEDASKSRREKKAIIFALGEIRDSKAFDPLMKLFKDDDEIYKRSAMEALGKIGDIRVFDDFISLLEDPAYLVQAATALGDLKDVRAVQPLLNKMGVCFNGYISEDRFHQLGIRTVNFGSNVNAHYLSGCIEIAKALGKIGDVRALDTLKHTLLLHGNRVGTNNMSNLDDAMNELESLKLKNELVYAINKLESQERNTTS